MSEKETPRAANIFDVARLAGVSHQTVSRVLNGLPNVRPATKERVEQAIAQLRYSPSPAARALVTKRTRTIGLILTSVTNPVLAQVAHQVERWLAQKGYGTLFASSNNDATEEQRVIDMFRARRVDGILAYPSNHQDLERFRRLRAAVLPVVMLVDDPQGGVDSVAIDEPLGAERPPPI